MKTTTVRQILFCICLFLQSVLFGQSIEDYIHENAIEVSNLTKLEDSIYKKFSHYKITLVGEFHGTNESTEFVNSLTNLLTKNNETVLLGLEIPKDKLKKFNQKPILENLIKSDFFNDSSVDGRNSKSWFKLIARQLQNKKVQTTTKLKYLIRVYSILQKLLIRLIKQMPLVQEQQEVWVLDVYFS